MVGLAGEAGGVPSCGGAGIVAVWEDGTEGKLVGRPCAEGCEAMHGGCGFAVGYCGRVEGRRELGKLLVL